MNVGRVVLGVSTVVALVGAVGFAFVAVTSEPIQGPSIDVCGSPQGASKTDFHSMAASFVIKNTSGSSVTIRGLRATKLVGLSSARVTVADDADPEDVRF